MRICALITLATAIVLIAMCLVGCSRIIYSPDFCLFLNPISYSGDKDSEETIEQIQEYNAIFEEFCDAE
mgnify:CR=1 FL=1